MKKLLLVLVSGFFLTACIMEDKNQYEQTVLEQLQNDQDIKDYKIDPERMTQCVVDLSAKKMPGLFAWDPRRGPYYIGYSKLISLTQSDDPKKAMEQVKEIFGSGREVMQAKLNYSQSVMDCITALINERERSLFSE